MAASSSVSVDERLEQVAQLEQRIKDDATALNDALKLQELCEASDARVVFAAVMALSRLMLRWSRQGSLHVLDDATSKKQRLDSTPASSGAAHAQVTSLLKMLARDDSALQMAAFKVLTLFIGKLVRGHFLADLSHQLVRALALSPHLHVDLLTALSAELVHADMRYHTLVSLAELAERYADSLPSSKERGALPVSHEVWCQNVFVLLRAVRMPTEEAELGPMLVPIELKVKDEAEAEADSEPVKGKKRSRSQSQIQSHSEPQELSAHRRAYQRTWLALLRLEPALPEELRTHVLEHAHTLLIPHVPQPMLLLDWLSESYARGGEDALRALHALFLLVSQHGLDYPQLYPQLYAQFTPKVLESPLRAKLLRLTELFLTSPLLPTYLVACFVKKLLRLALTSSPDATLLVLHSLFNLFVVHPPIHYLVHRSSSSSSANNTHTPTPASSTPLQLNETVAMRTDPFLEHAALVEARESVAATSAWELRALMSHYAPTVAQAAKLFKTRFGKKLFTLKEEAEAASFEKMFDLENSRKVKKGVPLAFDEPKTLLKSAHFPGWTLVSAPLPRGDQDDEDDEQLQDAQEGDDDS